MTIDIDELERLRLLVARTAQYDNMERYHAALEAAAPELIAAYREREHVMAKYELLVRLSQSSINSLTAAGAEWDEEHVARLRAETERDTLRAKVEKAESAFESLVRTVERNDGAHAAVFARVESERDTLRAEVERLRTSTEYIDHMQKGAEAERAAVVKWLRGHEGPAAYRERQLADAIERGEHLKGGG